MGKYSFAGRWEIYLDRHAKVRFHLNILLFKLCDFYFMDFLNYKILVETDIAYVD